MESDYDLLSPESLSDNYVHQLQQTIDAYLPSYVFIGEALQNALDAVRQAPSGKHHIEVEIDFDNSQVTVRDDGVGFPNNPQLLFLGGGTKGRLKLAGRVGVGLKVVLFSSTFFQLRSRTQTDSFRFSLNSACDFSNEPRPLLKMPKAFGIDNDPLPATGTELTYRFPSSADCARRYLDEVYDESLPRGARSEFLQTLQDAVDKKLYPTRFAALIGFDLRRNSYLGMTSELDVLASTKVTFVVKSSEPKTHVGELLGELFDGQTTMSFEVMPGYLHIEDTVALANPPKPSQYNTKLGAGGHGLQRVAAGFNVTTYTTEGDYEQLILDARGNLPKDIEVYRRELFPNLRSIRLTISRIPAFEKYLPGGARRVISANGVVTRHSIDLTRGRNQQYIRCFDIVIDVDAKLNYGKTQITNMRLLGRVRQFLNDAYSRVIQNAAAKFVGKPNPFDEDERHDKFWSREDLGRPELTIRKVPRDENDVIALFFELAGLGHFPEFAWYGLSQRDRYDARAVIRRAGDSADILTTPAETDLRTVEFKLRAASILDDFDRDEKSPSEVQLIVAYEEGVPGAGRSQFQFMDVEHSQIHDRAPEKLFPHVTRVLLDTMSGKEIQVLLVRDVLTAAYPPPPAPEAPADASDE